MVPVCEFSENTESRFSFFSPLETVFMDLEKSHQLSTENVTQAGHCKGICNYITNKVDKIWNDGSKSELQKAFVHQKTFTTSWKVLLSWKTWMWEIRNPNHRSCGGSGPSAVSTPECAFWLFYSFPETLCLHLQEKKIQNEQI